MTAPRLTNILLVLLLGTALGLAAWETGLAGGGPAAGQATSAWPDTAGLTVTGEGLVTTMPDLAIVRVGAMSRSPAVQEALETNDQRMEAIMATLRKAGLPDGDIQTQEFSLSSEVREFPPEEKGTTYVVRHILAVRVPDLDGLGELLESLSAAGANEMWGLQLSIQDPEALQAQARSRAVDAARQRAAELAGLAGLQLGPVIDLTEEAGTSVPEGAMGLGGGGGAPIAAGELTVRVRVRMTFAIR